jgi:hypothetical protein
VNTVKSRVYFICRGRKTSAYSTGTIWFGGTLFPGDLHAVRQFCDRLLTTVGCDADADLEELVQSFRSLFRSDSNLNIFTKAKYTIQITFHSISF